MTSKFFLRRHDIRVGHVLDLDRDLGKTVHLQRELFASIYVYIYGLLRFFWGGAWVGDPRPPLMLRGLVWAGGVVGEVGFGEMGVCYVHADAN